MFPHRNTPAPPACGFISVRIPFVKGVLFLNLVNCWIPVRILGRGGHGDGGGVINSLHCFFIFFLLQALLLTPSPSLFFFSRGEFRYLRKEKNFFLFVCL
ncbi:hypothetical protein DFH27DRAFT_566397 [Peziza echinospora]|nr:hypothetical protein DFH27DRAFT_566397 [Peziza echinospora]